MQQADSKKRPRRNDEDSNNSSSSNSNKKEKTSPATAEAPPAEVPPPYGSKAYWEERYQTQFAAAHLAASDANGDAIGKHTFPNDDNDDDDAEGEQRQRQRHAQDTTTLAYHAWYFTYDELRPLLLPLLLGGREPPPSKQQQQQQHEDDEAAAAAADAQPEDDGIKEDGNKDVESVEEEDDDDDEENICDDDDDSSDDDDDEGGVPDRMLGLSSGGPVAILELGCGDVPLGAALARDVRDLARRSVVSHIICTDFSPTVIDTMRQQYSDGHDDDPVHGNDETDVTLEFATVDARKLPYPSAQFALVLEKGTLDAILSDPVDGTNDCVAVVAEAARVLTPGGCLVLVSHLNAHTPHGLRWLEQVVFAGLQQQQQQVNEMTTTTMTTSWEIEVHGNDDDNDDDENEENSSDEPGSSPTVYIIHKKVIDPKASSSPRNNSTSTIPVKFFTY